MYTDTSPELAIPAIGPEDDAFTAACAYAKAGWYVVPVKHGTKHPGSVLGKGWQQQSTRDPQEIAALWLGTNHGIALHCGRSGAVVLDIDNPDHLPAVIRDHAGQPPTQQTRPEQPDRKHLVYTVPEGRHLGNGNGKLGGAWGEVRGQNGVIVVAPSHHPEGGEYRWQATGVVPVLPEQIAALLPNADLVDADAATDQQVSEFLTEHNTNSQPGLLGALINRWHQQIAAGHSRHQTAVTLMCWAMDEAAAGIYPADVATRKLRDLFMASKTQPSDAGGRALMNAAQAARAWDGIAAWAVGRTIAKSTEVRQERVERVTSLPTLEQLAGVGQQPTPPTPAAAPSPATAAPVKPPGKITLITADTIADTTPEWCWQWDGRGRILKGGLTLFAGRPAAGKSTAARWFAAGWTQGTLPGCWEGKPVNVAYLAAEESWNHTVVPSLKAAGADMSRIHVMVRDGNPARIKSIADEADMLAAFTAHNVRAVILDPLMSTIAGTDDTYRSNEVREALDPWVRISEAIDGVVLGISHLIKSARDVTAGINGSSAFGEVARCVFGFAVDRDAGDGTRVMTQSKNSSGVDGLNLAYQITEQRVTVSDGGTPSVARFTLIGNTDRDVRDILHAEQAGGRDTGSECAQWLRGYLATKGPTPALEVRSDGAEVGFSEFAIKRAMRKLKVQSERLREAGGPAVWSLPSAAGE